MQSKPSNWPDEGDIETIPEMFLAIENSQWPPSTEGVPLGTAQVADWSVSRQITGGALPGQVRGAFGHSVASGSASFPQPAGAPLSPWGRGSLNVGPGGKCILYASHKGASLADGLMLGRFRIAPISGSNVSNAVNLELDDGAIDLQRPFKLNWYYNPSAPTFDVSWVLGKIAAAGGYTQTDIQSTNSPAQGIFGIEGETAWQVAQQIAAATMGAVWVTEDGVFTYRNREFMRGVAGYTETIEALDKIESLEWTVDPGEVADRVEVTYTPTEILTGQNTITLWEATEPIKVYAERTFTMYAEITGTTDRTAPFVPLWNPSNPNATIYNLDRMSRWAASTAYDGSGAQPSDSAIRIETKIVDPSRIRMRITNTTTSDLWLVDNTGNPCLILRTGLHVRPSEPVTLSSGADEDDAVNPLQIDTGAWVQDVQAAQEILDWVTAQTARPKATLPQVRVKPDLARQVGDVVRILDESTGLRAKALISGVSLSGSASAYTQNLDLALMDVVFADFDRWCIQNGIDTFGEFDDWCIANGVTFFSQFDSWLTDFGGTL